MQRPAAQPAACTVPSVVLPRKAQRSTWLGFAIFRQIGRVKINNTPRQKRQRWRASGPQPRPRGSRRPLMHSQHQTLDNIANAYLGNQLETPAKSERTRCSKRISIRRLLLIASSADVHSKCHGAGAPVAAAVLPECKTSQQEERVPRCVKSGLKRL